MQKPPQSFRFREMLGNIWYIWQSCDCVMCVMESKGFFKSGFGWNQPRLKWEERARGISLSFMRKICHFLHRAWESALCLKHCQRSVKKSENCVSRLAQRSWLFKNAIHPPCLYFLHLLQLKWKKREEKKEERGGEGREMEGRGGYTGSTSSDYLHRQCALALW